MQKNIKIIILIWLCIANQSFSSNIEDSLSLFCNNYKQNFDVALRVREQLIGYHLERFSRAKKNLKKLQLPDSESHTIWSKICLETLQMCDKAHSKILADFDKVLLEQKEDIEKKMV